MKQTVFMEEMTWPEIQQVMKDGVDSVLIPLAAIEQHGPHLPIITDTWLGYVLCGPIAGLVGNMLVAPPLAPGRSDHHMDFAGTLSLRAETFKAVLTDYCISLARHGFKNIVFVSTHGGNHQAAAEALSAIQAELPTLRLLDIGSKETGEVALHVNQQLNLDLNACGRHAGLTETSMLLATNPTLVHMDKTVQGWVGGYGPDFAQTLETAGIRGFSPYGILGDPRAADAELGRAILKGRAEGFASVIRERLGKKGKPDSPIELQAPHSPTGKAEGQYVLDGEHVLEEMTWPLIGDALREGWDTALVIEGSIEQHGPHLPLGTDTMLGYARGLRLVHVLDRTILAPVIRPGLSEHHMGFPGTISVGRKTFDDLVMDVCSSLGKHGFSKLVLMPSHGGNYRAMSELLPRLRTLLPDVQVVLLGREDSRAAHSIIQPKLKLDASRAGVHAGLMETSMMLAHRPELVDMSKAAEGWVGDFDSESDRLLNEKGTGALSPIGVLGDPRGANAQLGAAYMQEWTQLYAEAVRQKFRSYGKAE